MIHKTKILHVIESLDRGGKERQLATICKYVDKSRCAWKIAYADSGEDNYIQEYNLAPHVYHLKSKRLLSTFREINRLVSDFRPDLIYAWGSREAVLGFLVSVFRRISFVNGSIRHGIRIRRLGQFLRMLLLHISPHIVANSQAGLSANHLRRGYVIYNGIDEKFQRKVSEDSRSALRAKLLGLHAPIVVLTSVGNLVPYKDYFTVLEAMHRLHKRGCDFLYVVIGDGPLRAQIEDTILSYGLHSKVRLVGRVPNVEDYLSAADVLIHSSRGEGCSNAILEGMFMGLPIIASKTGGTPEITTSDNALLFEYKNSHQLRDSIQQVLDDPAVRERMGKASYEGAMNRFTPQIMIADFCSTIETILGTDRTAFHADGFETGDLGLPSNHNV